MSLSFSAHSQLVIVLMASMFHSPAANMETSCPLNFNVLRALYQVHLKPASLYMPFQCRYAAEGIRILRSEYLRVCWESYRNLIRELVDGVDVETFCGFRSELIWDTCLNITTSETFENRFSKSVLLQMRSICENSWDNGVVCESCMNYLVNLTKIDLLGPESEDVSGCSSYLVMYAAAFVNKFGPTDPGTTKCLFRLDYPMRFTSSTSEHRRSMISGTVLGCIIGIVGALLAVGLLVIRSKKFEKKRGASVIDETSMDLGLTCNARGSNLVKFKMDEIRKATRNFSRHNIIGKGNFGNIYKGVLPDGTEVACKRFKNVSASGDASFAHEVEVIASVKHVNLVALRGYCTSTVGMEGHQRIIVCDLMHNGSVYDHLFSSGTKKLSWPVRQKIALGTARGLAYLHNGVHPPIIHRDVKASNILLDRTLEPKLADFGLARFNSHEMTHLSTRVAGTLGYVAPEYAMFGQLSERSDVYSFGVVLLELLGGKRAYEEHEGKASLLTDWAWLLVNEGRALDIIEEDIPDLGPHEVVEQYVHIAVICAHPIVHARPRMEQVVNLLETNSLVSSTPANVIQTTTSQTLLPCLMDPIQTIKS
ncbi:hypothetical protein K2173_017881 [Erythroxylum novogranatense]|uniref:non-specific serine/threonine protein kinase n=1 Tax=Erythroxylum novogranatense TaxID=1862640 RepID=A0AAV8T3A8_9ROSI|nr:hypothetical protein K2173_017881 [Erythroxylum novogranatense]